MSTCLNCKFWFGNEVQEYAWCPLLHKDTKYDSYCGQFVDYWKKEDQDEYRDS